MLTGLPRAFSGPGEPEHSYLCECRAILWPEGVLFDLGESSYLPQTLHS